MGVRKMNNTSIDMDQKIYLDSGGGVVGRGAKGRIEALAERAIQDQRLNRAFAQERVHIPVQLL